MAEWIGAKKEGDIAEWYSQVCLKAELADYSPVKGCMIIRPNGYAIWQSIQDYFNENINKKTGVQNAYFPLFIPERFFKKEKEHAEKLSIEVAWLDKEVTGEGDRLAIRPTSETIMYDSYARWIRSYRDLPLKINQWCNVVRWETEATKLFLRSREFLWQEGHCAYETKEECDKDTKNYIMLYQKLCKELLALPTLVGTKTEKEKFGGADYTYTIEAFMPDGKALQCGTSHMLGQRFAKAFGIKFKGRKETEQLPFQNSWGLSTRLIGGLVMTHSDDKGLVLPPVIASKKVVIVPIFIENSKEQVKKAAKQLEKELDGLAVLDDREDYSPGWKFNEWEMKGIPLRIELGPKDLEKNQAIVVRRDTGEKKAVSLDALSKESVQATLDKMQKEMYSKAEKFLKESITATDTWKEFQKLIEKRKLIKVPFCGRKECEDEIKEKSEGATSRCIPFDDPVPKKGSKCFHCGKEAKQNVYFSKAY